MSGTRRLRYTGELPKSFTENEVGEAAPGDVFEVPVDQAERYLRRPDIEDAGGRRRRQPEPEAGPGGSEPSADDRSAGQDG